MGRHNGCRGDAVPRFASQPTAPQAQRADSVVVSATYSTQGGWLLCQPVGLYRTETPADRGSGSHGNHCIGPSGLSSQHASCQTRMGRQCVSPGPNGPTVCFPRPERADTMDAGATQSPGHRANPPLLRPERADTMDAGATQSPGHRVPLVFKARTGRQFNRTDTSPHSPQAAFDTPLRRTDRNDVPLELRCSDGVKVADY
jgi:hypothetical protein